MWFSLQRLAALAAFGSMLALAGCGDEAGNPLDEDDDNDTIDTTPPSTPGGLTVWSTGTTLIVEWNDNSEADLGGYVLEKSTDRGARWDSVGEILLASTYEDTYASRADYRVRARDLTGNESANTAPYAYIAPTGRGGKLPSNPL